MLLTRWLLLFATGAAAAQTPPNVLLILADDLGVDRVACYGEHPAPGHTPVIDALAAHGTLFRNAWAYPVCSPSRVSLMTGKEPRRHGVGAALEMALDTVQLWPGDVTLPDALAPDYASLCVGKWHMGIFSFDVLHHAQDAGFAHFAGNLSIFPGFIGNGYFDYEKVVDGVPGVSTTYNTTDIVDDALAALPALPEPWFTFLSFNAPHSPFHKPPPALHTFNLPPNVSSDVPLHMKAMVEAMDTEIGRLLVSMDPAVLARTVVIFVGDNGTDKAPTTAPFLPSHAKGTVYDGGVHVPLIVYGPGVAAGAECEGLVQITDLFATIAELAGKPHATALDSVSLLPYFTDPAQPSLRATVRSEFFDPPGFGPYVRNDRAARDGHFKLLRFWTPSAAHEELYDLSLDPFELSNLLAAPLSPEAAAAYAALSAVIDPAPATWNEVGEGLPGVAGEPRLSGTGALAGLDPATLSLQSAAPFAPAVLAVGTSWFGKQFKGGVMGPLPALLLPPLMTSATGSLLLGATWPAGLPSQSRFLFQAWIADATAEVGLASSNNVIATTP